MRGKEIEVGQAKNRGTYEQRKASAITQAEEDKADAKIRTKVGIIGGRNGGLALAIAAVLAHDAPLIALPNSKPTLTRKVRR